MPRVPFLKLAAVANDGGGVSLFAVNRDLARPTTMEVRLDGSLSSRSSRYRHWTMGT